MDAKVSSGPLASSTTRLVIGITLPPHAEIVFVSSDDRGTPGKLNSQILKDLGYPISVLQDPLLARNGYLSIHEEGQPTVMAIVTISGAARPNFNLRRHFSRAIRNIREHLPSGQGELWVPLMGTGAAGLSRRESFEILLDVLIKEEESWVPYTSALYLSCDGLTSIKEIEEFTAYAQRRLSKLPIQVTSEDIERESDSPEGTKTSSASADTVRKRRKIQDDSETQVDATNGRPGMGFDHIAARLVRIVSDISAAAHRYGPSDARSTYKNFREARLTVGIFAPWGAGKSTLIRELHRQFREAGHLVVVINPWKWAGNGDLHDYVRDEVIQQFSSHGSEVSLARLKLRRFGRAYGRWIWAAFILLLVAAVTGPKLLPIVTKLVANSGEAWSEILSKFGLSDLAPLAVLVAPRFVSWASKTGSNWLQRGKEKNDINIGAAGLSLAYQDIARLLLQEGELKPFVFFF